MDETGFAVVGAQNFAAEYISNIRSLEDEGIRLTGVVVDDQRTEGGRARELRRAGIRVFDSYEDLLRNGHRHVDVIGLPTSIASHAELSIAGMTHGYDILLEKPPAPTIGELEAIRRTAERTGQFCSVGFQYLHAPSIRRLKRELLDGAIGELESVACKGGWPRTDEYYARNSWAGRLVHRGDVVLDGPVNNAFAHFLQNMLFLTGSGMHETGTLSEVTAERYRANPEIEAADIACLTATTERGVDLGFYVTHVPLERRDPYTLIEGTDGTAEWHYSGETTIRPDDGEPISFDNGEADPGLDVFRRAAEYERGAVDALYCTPENTRAFVTAVNGSFESSRTVVQLPDSAVSTVETDDGAVRRVADGIDELIDDAFQQRALLSDTGVEWAEPTAPVDVTDYTRFTPLA